LQFPTYVLSLYIHTYIISLGKILNIFLAR
jgi:hypothetical protein